MIFDWVAAKAQHFLPAQNIGLDELSVSFDFALSPEIMGLLHAQNDGLEAGGTGEEGSPLGQRSTATHGAVAEAGQQDQAANMATLTQLALDEHELALA
jgi:hypothetical protein